MNYLCVIGKYKRGWHGIFPDFAGQIIVGASTQKALEVANFCQVDSSIKNDYTCGHRRIP